MNIDFNSEKVQISTLGELHILSGLIGLIGADKFNVVNGDGETITSYKDDDTLKFVTKTPLIKEYMTLVLGEITSMLNEL